MRAVQAVRLEGPAGVDVVEVPEPVAREGQVLVDVHAVGMSYPDLLLSAGQYQLKPETPFCLGVDFAGVVREAPEASGFTAGDRVACVPTVVGSLKRASGQVSKPDSRRRLQSTTFNCSAGMPNAVNRTVNLTLSIKVGTGKWWM